MDYGHPFYRFLLGFRPSGNHPFYQLVEFLLSLDRAIVPIVLDKIKGMHFDYVIHDIMLGGGNIIAKKLNLPAISSCTSFVINNQSIPDQILEPGLHPQLDFIYTELQNAAYEWKIGPIPIMDILFKKEAFNLVYTSMLFQPDGFMFDDSFHFVGPTIQESNENLDFSLKSSSKIIYISVEIKNKFYDFYLKCKEAFSNENYQVILSLGDNTDLTTFGTIPDNFIIRNNIPQSEILKYTDVFISNGGLISVSEAFYYGVPVIALPQSKDQPMVARQLSSLGAGLELKLQDITAKLLKDSVQRILSNSSFKQKCVELSDSFLCAGGYKEAAKQILNYNKTLVF
jgi:MGT family glycosyltransferase